MANRAGVAMSPEQVAAYLAAPRTMIVATIGPDGMPHQTAVWYVMNGTDPIFWTYTKSQKVVNLLRDPRISCFVEDGRQHRVLRGVALTGRAAISTHPADIEATWRRLTTTYSGPVTDSDEANFARQAGKRCVITVGVERVTSWDHRKLTGHVDQVSDVDS
jgi:PPOX class probable F420-dependent enzyme